MAAVTREQVMNALLAQLKADATVVSLFQTISRRFYMWEQIAQVMQSGQVPVRQPALYLFDGVGLGGGMDRYEPQTRSLPPLVTLRRTVVIYAQLPGGGTPGGQTDMVTPGGTVLNPLIDAVQAVIDRPTDSASNANTLGGIVSHCWLKGEGVFISGEIDPNGQCMATLPLEILMFPSQ
jgi:hypothetical protein